MIRSIGDEDHTCERVMKNPEVTSSWAAQKLFATVKANPNIGSYAVAEELRKRFGITTRRKMSYCARQKALKMVASDYSKSYAKLNAYANMILLLTGGLQWRFSLNYKDQEHFLKEFSSVIRHKKLGLWEGVEVSLALMVPI